MLPVFPQVETSRLLSGLRIGLVQRSGSLVNVAVVIPIPRAPNGEDLGWIAAQALTDRDPTNQSLRGTLWRGCLAVGCEVNLTTDPSSITITVETLASNQDIALKALASLFSAENLDVEATRRAQAALLIRRASRDAAAHANELIGRLLFENDPQTVLKTPDIKEIESLRRSLFDTGRSTMLLVGAIKPMSIRTKIQPLFISSSRTTTTPTASNESSPNAAHAAVYFIDEPGRSQTLILSGQRLGQLTPEIVLKARLATSIVGNRVNTNLRTEHQWSYGAQARLATAFDGSALLLLSTEVQDDKTAAAIAEIRRELDQHTPTSTDATRLPFYRLDMSRQIISGTATVAGTNAVLAELARRGFPLTAYPVLLKEASELGENSLKAALQLIDSQHTIFLLVQDGPPESLAREDSR